jgi:hypothetical protein
VSLVVRASCGAAVPTPLTARLEDG